MKKRRLKSWAKQLIIIVILIVITLILYTFIRQDETQIVYCIVKGYGEDYCVRSLYDN